MENLKRINILTQHLKLSWMFLFVFCLITHQATAKKTKSKNKKNTAIAYTSKRDSITKKVVPIDILPAKNTISNNNSSSSTLDDLIAFAKEQLGTRYLYGSEDPQKGGLDCSGFVYYVMTKFKYKVPRSSKDYMNFGTTISKDKAQEGDVILFTGTDASVRVGGHVGIVLGNDNGEITFIHSSSGKGKGVMISKLSEGYYTQRFLKIVRVIN